MKIDHLPTQLYTSQQVRDIDHSAIHQHGIDGYELMTRAAQFSFDTLRKKFPEVRSVVCLCGSGNNAGDAYIVAGMAKNEGMDATAVYLSAPENLKGDAHSAYQYARNAGVTIEKWHDRLFDSDDESNSLIVDGLLGTGLNTEVTGVYADAINQANKSGLPIVAIDIPSGLCANTGRVFGTGIKASITTTFIGMKVGLLTGMGRSQSGDIFYHRLGVPRDVLAKQKPVAKRLTLSSLSDSMNQLSPRAHHAHKGLFGHTLIIGGNIGYGGAALLAAEASLRTGSGLTSLITHETNLSASLARGPEIMCVGHLDQLQRDRLLESAGVIVLGPGLGRDAWSERMLQEVLDLEKPVVLDADALNLIASSRDWRALVRKHAELRVITPHPGEAARLLSSSTKAIQDNRLHAIESLASALGCHTLLKGSGSLIIDTQHNLSLCAYGNPGMSSGGMGDVLAGTIGALISQGLEPGAALKLGVTLHALAADSLAIKEGCVGMAARDVIPAIRDLINQY